MLKLIVISLLALTLNGCGTIEQSVSTSISPYDSREIEKVNVSFRYTYTFPK